MRDDEFLELLPHHAALTDPSGRIVAANRRWLEFASSIQGPVRLDRAFVYFDQKDPGFDVGSRQAVDIVSRVHEVMRGKRDEYEVDYTREVAGEKRTFRLVARASRGTSAKGAPSRTLLTRRDLTAERFDQQRLWQFEFALKRTGQFVVFLDARGRILFANDRICRTLGHSRESLLGSHLWDIDPHHPEGSWQTTLGELRQLGTLNYRSELRTLEGLLFPVEVSANYVERQGAEFIVVFSREPGPSSGELHSGSFRFQQRVAERTSKLAEANERLQQEIASHEQTESALRKSQERFELAMWGTSLGLWDWDIASGRMIFDDRWAGMLGYGVGEIEPHLEGWTGLVHPDDEAALRRSLDEHLLGKTETYEFAHRLNHHEGEYRWFLARGRVVERDPSGNARRVTGTLADITEQKQLESQLLQSQKMEAIGRLAGGVAHDFNNLLTAINGYADLVLRQLEQDSPHRDRITEIRRAGERATVLTTRLLAFGRQQVMQPESLDLNAIVRNLEPLLLPAVGAEIEVHVELEDELPYVRTDLAQMEQAMLNMVVNARDAMPSGGSLWLRTRRAQRSEVRRAAGAAATLHPEYVCLSIQDTGVGIDDEVLDRVFDPFFTTKAPGQGTGLGLSMVYGIVRQSDGHLDVRSRPDHGTEFRIYLPTTSRATSGVHRLSSIVGTDHLQGSETVLLVEDEQAVRELVASTLTTHGYRVIEAEHAEEALQRVSEATTYPKLLVSDVVLPGRSGPELAQELRRTSPGLEVLFVSGYPRDSIDRQDIQDESVNFLQKPFELDALLAAVRRLLDRRAKRDGTRVVT